MDENFSCDICGIKCSGIEPYMQHMDSIKHKKKKEQGKLQTTYNFDGSFYCQSCDVACTGITPYQQHLKSDKHVKKEQAKLLSKKYDFASSVVPDHPESQGSNSVSGSSVTSHEKYALNSSTEEVVWQSGSNLAIPIQNQFKCLVCAKQFNGPVPFDIHMNSAVHKKNLKKMEMRAALISGQNDFSRTEVSSPNQAYISTSASSNDLGKPLTPVESTPLKCDSCDKSFPSMEMLNLHNLSSGHCQLTSLQNGYVCQPCDKKFTGRIPLLQHINSPVHQKKIMTTDMLQKVVGCSSLEGNTEGVAARSFDNLPSSFGLNIVGGNSDLPVAECYVCGVKFYSDKERLEHYESESHHDNQNIYDFRRKVKVFMPEEPFDLTA